jgi:outer membrane receptor for ferrienterochelin and colicin
MNKKQFKYSFSKHLILAAIAAIEEINKKTNEAEQMNIYNTYAGIFDATSFLIETYMNENDNKVKEEFLRKLKEQINTIEINEIEEDIEKENKYIYRGKGKVEA